MKSVTSEGNWDWINIGFQTGVCNTTGEPAFEKNAPNRFGESFKDPVLTVNNPLEGYNYKQRLFVKSQNPSQCSTYFFGTDTEDKSAFTSSARSLITPYTNPPFLKRNKSQVGIGINIIDLTNNELEIKFYNASYNHYTINEDLLWDRQIFLDQNATVNSNSEITLLDGTTVYPSSSQSVTFANNSTFLVDNRGNKTTVTIENGVTVNVNSGASLELESGTGGLAANKTTLIVKGVLNINSGSTVDLGDHALIIAEDGGEVNVSSGATINSTVIGEFNAGNNGLVTFTGNHSFNSSVCLMTLPGGTMEFNGTLILDNGAFIQTHSTGGGTYIFNDNVTLKGSGNSAGYVMDLNEGSTVEIGYNKRILTYNGAKMRSVGIQSNSVRFTYVDPAGYPDEAWDKIELRGDGNIFEYAVFEYGVNPLYFRSDNNEVSYSNIKNNLSYGIRTDSDYSGGWGSVKVTDSKIENNGSHGVYARNSHVSLEYNDIKDNSGDGVYVYNAHVGHPTNGMGYFRGNDIYNNNSNAVQVAYNGDVYDGYSTMEGNNNLDRNNSHEVYLSSTNARWWDANGGSYTAVLENTSSTATKYVYNLAQTTSGESAVSWKVGMENNAWDYAVPSSGKFHGRVDYTPYQTSQMFGSVGPRGTVPAKIMRSGAVDFGQSVLSSATTSEVTESFTTDGERDYYLEVRKEIATLQSEINDNPNHVEVPSKLNGLLGYYNELPSDNKTEFPTVKPLIASFVSDRHLQGITRGVSQNERLASETALMLEANQYYEEGNPEGALATIDEVEGIIANLDLQREIGFIKAASLEDIGEYQQAIDVYLSLSELSKRGIDPENTATDYADEIAHLEERIYEREGVEVDTQRDGEGKIKVASDTMPTKIALHAAYPNPFNPSTVLSFDLPDAGVVKVEFFDVNGRLVSVLTNQAYQAGTHSLQFDAGTLASGIYLIRADIAGSIQTQKITLIK